jgi:hypothetical protein
MMMSCVNTSECAFHLLHYSPEVLLPELSPIDPVYVITATSGNEQTVQLTYKIQNTGDSPANFPLFSDAAVF